jgi:hypothetical protein
MVEKTWITTLKRLIPASHRSSATSRYRNDVGNADGKGKKTKQSYPDGAAHSSPAPAEWVRYRCP